MKKDKNVIEVVQIQPTIVTLHIIGDSDLVLNKMDDPTKRELMRKQKDEPKKLEKINEWEKVVTSIHWLGGEPSKRYKPEDYSEEVMKDLLKNDAPCIEAFGFKKQCANAVVRFKLDSKKTDFMACIHILTNGSGLIPIRFAEHFIDENLVPTNTIGRVPVLSLTNRFSGWNADVTVSFIDSVISLDNIVNIVNLTGYGIGIGSRTSADFGLFHVEGVH